MEATRIEKLEFPVLNKLSVSGFKSIRDEQSIEIKGLTILAGANSSGKSSMMQPVLLLKQTLEAPFDPGPLLLNGPNVKFTKADQLLSRFGNERSQEFEVKFGIGTTFYNLAFSKKTNGFTVKYGSAYFDLIDENVTISEETPNDYLSELYTKRILKQYPSQIAEIILKKTHPQGRKYQVHRDRCFLELIGINESNDSLIQRDAIFDKAKKIIERLIHLPGLRGNPERVYPRTAVGNFPGTFEVYTASILDFWQEYNDLKFLRSLTEDLSNLNLTWKVESHRINDAQVEIRVGRLPKPGKGGYKDLINIADVGFGVSQVLPVLVALHAANPGQIVYLEQPEIHLHPRAQLAMAEILANAAKRGVLVIAETHSKLLLLSIQALVAENKLPPELVSLNWFQRDKNGMTHVTQGVLDEYGRLGDWPEDFDDVSLDIESRYLNAIDKRMAS